MKTAFNTITALLLLIPAIILGNGNEPGKYSKQKTIRKAYLVNPDAGIDITNAYGNIYVTTWNEDKVDIEVLVKVSGDDENWVNDRLNDIDVDFEALKNLVTARTVIGNQNKTGGKSNSIEINYTIRIPKNGSVKLDNKYGSITTTDLLAGVDIECSYGKINLAKLTGGNSKIDLAYCTSSVIESIKTGSISADYSKLTLSDFGTINLNADYTDFVALRGDNIKYDSNYGKLVFGKINDLNGSGDYLSVKADEISGSFKMQTQYSKITVGNVNASASDININSQYTTVDLNYDANYAFDFDVDVQYANFKHDTDVKIESKTDGNTSKSYQGFYKKEGANKVRINSQYGNVKLAKTN